MKFCSQDGTVIEMACARMVMACGKGHAGVLVLSHDANPI